LRVTEDASKEEKWGSEEGCCVHGSRVRKPVPPPILYVMLESEPLGGLGKLRNNSGLKKSPL